MNNTELPEPEDSGSDGRQIKADTKNELIPARPLVLSVASVVAGLAVSNSRAFGGEVAATLIAGATSQMAVELEQAKHDLATLRLKNDTLVDVLTEERIQKAIMIERIDSFRSTRHLKNIGIAIGTLLLSAGFQLIKNGADSYGLCSIAFGFLLLLAGWLSAPKGGDK